MLVIKNITIKNFMSIGAVSQSVDFTSGGLTLVLGENLDMGGNGNRNGVGKTSIVNALSYALYGQALTNIKKDNLINTVNKKNMVVSVEFEKDGIQYRIERGRKPNFFKYYVNDESITDSTGGDEAQGENKDTQKDIDAVLGVSYSMFRHIVCLNTYTEPFLSMGAARQREIIEELLPSGGTSGSSSEQAETKTKPVSRLLKKMEHEGKLKLFRGRILLHNFPVTHF